MALQIARGVVTGEPFLGKSVVQTGKVIYFALEDEPIALKGKLIDQGAKDLLDSEDVTFFFDIPRDKKSVEAGLKEQVENIKPILIVIDNWMSYATGWLKHDTNSAKDMAYLTEFLRDLATEKKMAGLILMHPVKPNQHNTKGPERMLGSQIQTITNKNRLEIRTPNRYTFLENASKLFPAKPIKIRFHVPSYTWRLHDENENDWKDWVA